MEHCVARILDIVARNQDDRRSILQLGYNLGRLSELTGLGRELFWDRWKDAVADWNHLELVRLAQELRNYADWPEGSIASEPDHTNVPSPAHVRSDDASVPTGVREP